MILSNARVGGEVVDVRIDGDEIVEIGSVGHAGIDLGGRWLGPGLWDWHVHFGQWALSRQRVDLSAATSAAEAAAIVASAPRPIAGLPLVGQGFRDGLWPDAPTATLLDRAAPGIPVVLISGDLHCAWLNSAAMAVYGARETLVREEECFAVVRALDDVPTEILDGWVADAGRAAAERGVVGVVDFEMAWSIGDWQRRMAAGFDSLRVRAGVYPQYLDRAVAEGLRSGQALGDLLEVGPFKIITDGSLNTRTAYCVDPYPGLGDYRGLLTVPQDELVDWLRRASAAGFEPAVHAIGDEANTLALDAFETAGCHGRIEHAQLVSTADFPRFRALGVVPSVQPEHAMDDRDVADRFWAGRTDRAFALRSLVDARAALFLGSDAPVAPLDPWVTMAAAVGRSRDGREPWHPEQGITNGMALASSTVGGVGVGATADLVVTELDPFTATADELRTMPVAATLLAGRFTYSAL